ncbi:phosphate/phosphite/phosphonate ABC transporter substrate-binding protein [Dulcicalothrix desertica]|nr:PhnD/SsuA/transferrin family substrate-binding protein [Dulcicalothrix desertica]TWH53353.1 phosphonate transport system substrate-binding protein [Dulcicalothrix desertica PCC 7102]
MPLQLCRRSFILQMLFIVAACSTEKLSRKQVELVVGIVNYEDSKQTLKKFARFKEYLGNKTKALVQLEPAFNESIAIERIQRQSWSLVFAPPGLAALASTNYKYELLFSLNINVDSRACLVVRSDSSLRDLKDLQGKTVALGTPGAASGYYFPLYNLYGLTLKEVLFAPTPSEVIKLVADQQADVGAVSWEEFNLYHTKFNNVEFRVLFTDSHNVPPGAVLIAPNVETTNRDLIKKYMREASPTLIQEIGYIPNADVPDYKYMSAVIDRVARIATRLSSKPVRLF